MSVKAALRKTAKCKHVNQIHDAALSKFLCSKRSEKKSAAIVSETKAMPSQFTITRNKISQARQIVIVIADPVRRISRIRSSCCLARVRSEVGVSFFLGNRDVINFLI